MKYLVLIITSLSIAACTPSNGKKPNATNLTEPSPVVSTLDLKEEVENPNTLDYDILSVRVANLKTAGIFEDGFLLNKELELYLIFELEKTTSDGIFLFPIASTALDKVKQDSKEIQPIHSVTNLYVENINHLIRSAAPDAKFKLKITMIEADLSLFDAEEDILSLFNSESDDLMFLASTRIDFKAISTKDNVEKIIGDERQVADLVFDARMMNGEEQAQYDESQNSKPYYLYPKEETKKDKPHYRYPKK